MSEFAWLTRAKRLETSVLRGLWLWCVYLYPALSKKLRAVYPQYISDRGANRCEFIANPLRVIETICRDEIEEEQLKLALWCLDIIAGGVKLTDTQLTRAEAAVLLQDVSLLRCQMGAPGAMGDVRRYFAMVIDTCQKQMEFMRAQLQHSQVEHAELVDGSLHAETIRRLQSIVDDLNRGDAREAIKYLAKHEEVARRFDPDDPSQIADRVFANQGYVEVGPRKGKLSVFVREPEGDSTGMSVARELIHTNYHTATSLLQTFQRDVGHA